MRDIEFQRVIAPKRNARKIKARSRGVIDAICAEGNRDTSVVGHVVIGHQQFNFGTALVPERAHGPDELRWIGAATIQITHHQDVPIGLLVNEGGRQSNGVHTGGLVCAEIV